MAKVARPRLKKAGIDLADLQLLELNPTKLLPAQREALTKAVHKITDGKTQTEFLIEEGIMKVPQGGAGTGGKRTRKGEKLADLSPAEKEAQLKTIAIDYYRALLPALNQHLNERMSWQYLSDDLDAIVSLPMLRSVLADGLKLVDATLETRKAEALDRHRRTAATIAHTVEA
jgi:hypothetical protein